MKYCPNCESLEKILRDPKNIKLVRQLLCLPPLVCRLPTPEVGSTSEWISHSNGNSHPIDHEYLDDV